MDNIEYKDIHAFGRDELERLFMSVEWSSGHYPDKLVEAMKNYETVYSAWDGDRLVGMICAMDDGVLTAYVTSACGSRLSASWHRPASC